MSGTTIITKFSLTTAQPASNALAQGEQAYSFVSDKLWIGWDNAGVIDPIAIGGKYYTDLLPASSATHGSVTASSAIVTDSSNKIDLINIDNITIDGNTISTTNTNGDLIVNPNGSGEINLQGNTNVVSNLTVSGTQSVTGQSTFASANVTDLTSGRVLLAGAAGELEDSANLTFSGTTLTVTGAVVVDNIRVDGNTISATDTNGSVTLSPSGTGLVVVNTSEALVVASGSEASRPTALSTGDGAIRYNTTTGRFEGTVSGSWTGLGGVVDVDQDTYITAEETADEDVLRFYTAGTEEMSVAATGVTITDQVTVPTATITTSNETTANIGTANISTALTVSTSAVDFQNGIDVTNGNVDITDNLNVTGNTVIGGNLTVNGTTTTVNSTVTELTDPVIQVGNGSLAAGDANDRGVNFEYGDGAPVTPAVQTGFFGMDMETKRFSYKPIVDTTDENYVAPWGDAQFGQLFLSGAAEIAGNVGINANQIDTTAGDLTIAPAGGDTNVTGNLAVSGALTAASLDLTTALAVVDGGTGLSSFTGNGVFISNAAGTAVSFVTGTGGDLIQFNDSGVPYASSVIDGGTF